MAGIPVYRRVIFAAFLAVVSLGAVLTSCAPRPELSADLGVPISQVEVFAPSPVARGNYFGESEVDEAEFAFRLAAELFTEADPNGNVICSPFSAWLPLAALANATDKRSKQALLDSLGVKNATDRQLNMYAKKLLYAATSGELYGSNASNDVDSQLMIANALLIDRNKDIRRAVAQTFADHYAGTERLGRPAAFRAGINGA